MFRPAFNAEIESVQEALGQAGYSAAFDLLEQAVRRFRRPAEQAQLSLQLAAIHLLYGEAGALRSWQSLEAAGRLERSISNAPLFRALHWECRAYQGAPVRQVRRGVAALADSGDAAVHYHRAGALYLCGLLSEAQEALLRALQLGPPAHLLWRCHSLLALVFEELGEPDERLSALRNSVRYSHGPDRESERLSYAACLLDLGRSSEAVSTLNQIDETQLIHPSEHLQRLYLLGCAESDRDNPNLALSWLSRARLEHLAEIEQPDEDAYRLLQAEADLLSDAGRFAEACERYRDALHFSPAELVPYAHHELAVALAEADQLDDAEAELGLALQDPEYAYRAEALAEVGEIRLRLGDSEQAELNARAALAIRPVPAAFICLGSLAFDYYRLDEAVSWFEQAAETAGAGSAHWLLAQQLLADVFALMGPEQASRLYQHASNALHYTDRNHDWYLTLRSHQETAQHSLITRRRPVN